MRKKTAFITLVILLSAVFLMHGNAFAVRAEFEMMQKLQEEQKPQIDIVKPKVEYTSEGLRDPFKTPFEKKYGSSGQDTGAADGTLALLKLQGIVWGGKFPQAIINEQVVKIGDTVEGALVTDINKYGVVLLVDGKQYTLSSPASEIGPYGESGGAE